MRQIRSCVALPAATLPTSLWLGARWSAGGGPFRALVVAFVLVQLLVLAILAVLVVPVVAIAAARSAAESARAAGAGEQDEVLGGHDPQYALRAPRRPARPGPDSGLAQAILAAGE